MKDRYALSAGPAPASTAPMTQNTVRALRTVAEHNDCDGRSARALIERDLIRLGKNKPYVLTPAGRRKLKEIGK